MDLAQNTPPKASALVADTPEPLSTRKKVRHATRPQLLTRDQLDGRTNAAKRFDRLVGQIEVDLGGAEQLSTIERTLIEAPCGRVPDGRLGTPTRGPRLAKSPADPTIPKPCGDTARGRRI